MKLAIKIYKLILNEVNGWDTYEVQDLTIDEIEADPVYDKIKSMIIEHEAMLEKIKSEQR